MQEKNICQCNTDYCCHNICDCSCCKISTPQINAPAPNFTATAYHHDEEKKIKLSDYKGRWVILFFYPADFTFVCPTELEDLAHHYEELKKLNAEILSVSTDTVYVHKAWHDTSDAIKKINFPMLADPTGNISRAYGVYIKDEGLALRGTFIIDPDGNLKTMEIHANGIGRSSKELMRKLQAAQFVSKYGDQACPANWEPGEKTLRPGMDLVGKI
ncbi:MAG: redoxin domain-containing protein [Patescibacteria group bacterium]